MRTLYSTELLCVNTKAQSKVFHFSWEIRLKSLVLQLMFRKNFTGRFWKMRTNNRSGFVLSFVVFHWNPNECYYVWFSRESTSISVETKTWKDPRISQICDWVPIECVTSNSHISRTIYMCGNENESLRGIHIQFKQS